MTRPCPGPLPPRPPKLKAPPGTCDCHAHILGPFDRFPLNEHRSYTPPPAPLEMYQDLMRTLGIQRTVIVHGSAHGTDLSVTIDTLERLGDHARGVSVISPDISDSELDRLHSAGFRGARLTTMLRGGVGVENVAAVARRIARLGWHVQIFVNGPEEMEDVAPKLKGLPVPVVIDAMGRFKAEHGVNHAGFKALLRLFETEDCWVKMFAVNRLSQMGPPFSDVTPFAKQLLGIRPDRLVWGTDWPHVMVWDHPMPDDADLLDWLLDWDVDSGTRQAVLVDNPARLYGFPPL